MAPLTNHIAILEFDTGSCHMLDFSPCRIENEPMARLSLSNSLGETELIIETADSDTFGE